MSASPWIAALFALFVWWFSTGAILFVVRRAENTGRRADVVILALPVLALGIAGFWASRTGTTVEAGYAAFLSALAIWGWIELAFLAGIVTGPNRVPCPPFAPFWERFIRAWGTIAYHEMALVGALIALALFSRGAENTITLWTFAVLFFARISAKLNLFLGVPKINVEFLPRALDHLPSHFRHARMNWLFPISVTVLTFATACWLERLIQTGSPAFALLAALTALALLEHWLRVLPLPDEKLWRWMIPAPKPKHQKTMTPGE